LKGKKENMNVRELFRRKLENSEVIPGDSVRSELMHKLAIKEFIHFNPLQFNVYYLGGIAAAALATVFILISNPSGNKNTNDKTRHETIIPSDTISIVEPEKKLSGEKPAENRIEVMNTNEKRPAKSSEAKNEIKNVDNKANEKKEDFNISVRSDSLKKKAVFQDNLSERNQTVDLQRTIGAAFDVSSPGGCTPLKVKFLNKSTSYDSCRWVFGDGGFSNKKIRNGYLTRLVNIR
jgi:hypothetical protein